MRTIQNQGPAEYATFLEDFAGLTEGALAGITQRLAQLVDRRIQTVGRWPQDSLVQRYWRPMIAGAIALDKRNVEKAIESLGVMGTYEMSMEGYLDPVYLRGQAYLMQHDGKAAAAEFQKITDHPGLAGYRPVGALARLGLARSYSLQGDTAKARAAQQDFLTLWKEADPDVPILKEAKAEYAKLK